MLDDDLDRLAGATPEVSLAAMETGVWARVQAVETVRRVRGAAAPLQLALAAAVLAVSIPVGARIARPPPSPDVLQISSTAAALAPSTLIGGRP